MSKYGEGSFQSSPTMNTSLPSIRPSLVFFGSGPVAATSLELLSKWATIEAVVTKPQPAHHKEPFPVLALAEQLGVPVFTPDGKAALSEFNKSHTFESTLGLVIDYGFIINKDVIDSFPLGIINSHFSLLPEWRGADPISFAILSGQAQTGVSLMLIVEKMDEGPILAFGMYDIADSETTPSLTTNLISLSDALLKEEIPHYLTAQKTMSQLEITEQFDIHPSYSRKLKKEDGILDFNKPAIQLEREIRAYLEWPKSRTTLAGKDVIITKAHTLESTSKLKALGLVSIKDKQLCIATSDGTLAVDALKPVGKPEMVSSAFLAGYGKDL